MASAAAGHGRMVDANPRSCWRREAAGWRRAVGFYVGARRPALWPVDEGRDTQDRSLGLLYKFCIDSLPHTYYCKRNASLA